MLVAVLNLDDDLLDTELIRADLAKGGIACEMLRVHTRNEFVVALEKENVDLILADNTLPEFDGCSPLKTAREIRPDVPFIFVSGTLGEEVAIELFKSGATDYVLKHRLERLVPAVRRAMNEVNERIERKRAEERSRFRATLLDAVGQAVIATDLRGKVIYWNQAAEEMYGWSAKEAMGQPAGGLVIPEDLQMGAQQVRAELRAGRSWLGEFVVRRKDGSAFPAMVTDTPVHDEQGNLVGIIGVSMDISELKATEELRRSEERFRLLVEGVGDYAIFMLDPEGRITSWNAGAERIKGYRAEEILGRHFSCFYTDEDLERSHPEEELRLAKEQGRYEEEGLRVRKDGSRFWASVLITALWDAEGNMRGFSKVVRDITERKRMEEQLHHQACHDPLTDLPNRCLLVDRLRQALRRTRRRRGRKVAVLFVDLDDFKAVNDSLGHEVGDRLLVVVSERLRGCIRPEDTLARFGGDEFVVLLDEVEGSDDALRIAERITEGFREPFVLDGRELFAKISMGIALGTARTKSPEDLLRDADTAMYQAKEDNLAYRMFDPLMYERAMDHLQSQNKLRRAVENREFVVHYQPIFSLRTGEVWGVEALVRWNHPERGLLDPSEFVAVAEESGIVVPMGESVLEEACRQGKEWQERHPCIPHLMMCVNLSARQLQRLDIGRTVERVLKKTGLEPRYLSLDITETVYIRSLESNTAALDELKRLGVRVSIDDFGTGYSSLSYLKQLPVDTLKVDKSFVKGLGEDLEDMAIVRMVIDLAHTLGKKVIAEGVESQVQALQLEEMGCDMAQGYLFSEPLPGEVASRFLANPLADYSGVALLGEVHFQQDHRQG